ncbi:MAG: hypothetical protein HW404_2515, partial [Anaerolineales bacterium]|nr:hypothetical protein [Anaerolineales bacterium]
MRKEFLQIQELESDPSVVRAGLAGDHLRA